MTSSYKSTQDQEAQEQLLTQPQNNSSSFGLDNLPTGTMPTANEQGRQNRQRSPWSFESQNADRTRQKPATRKPQQNVTVEGDNVILHRSTNFFVRTVNRTGQQANPLRRLTGRTGGTPNVLPDQDRRIAASDTRIMPQVTLINPVKKGRFPVPTWLEAIVVLIGLLASFAAHAINMFNFPRYELDEGTYMSSAWSIMHGMITPYPYGYGHPPLAWIQIAAWVQLTGGFFLFGNALNTGRVLMLLYAVASSLLVYLIVSRLSGSRSAGLLAMVIFSLSPLSLIYQRQVLLDNVATFWLLLSLYLLVVGNSRLLYVVLAAISFGVSMLSKEVFLLFMPAMIYAVWLHTTRFQRKFALVAFTYIIIALGSTFFLLAILKGELFPYSWHLPWDHHPHLSLIGSFIGQVQRGQSQGSFAASLDIWTQTDLWFIVAGAITVSFNLVAGWWNRKQLLLALSAISFWILLVRGGVVLPFYIIPLLPFMAMNAAMAVNTVMNWVGKLFRVDLLRAVLVLSMLAAVVPYDGMNSVMAFTQHPTSAQTDAMTWIREHVPHNSFIVINSYLYLDLRLPGGEGVGNGATFPHAEVYFNVATDPELHDILLQNNWDRIDYIVADSEMLSDINAIGGPFDLIKTALNHSIKRATFKAADHESQIVITIYQVQHKIPQPIVRTPVNGGGTAIASVNIPADPLLDKRHLLVG